MQLWAAKLGKYLGAGNVAGSAGALVSGAAATAAHAPVSGITVTGGSAATAAAAAAAPASIGSFATRSAPESFVIDYSSDRPMDPGFFDLDNNCPNFSHEWAGITAELSFWICTYANGHLFAMRQDQRVRV